MLSARRGFARWDWADWTSNVYLVLGTLLMFGPVAWLLLSSVKSPSSLIEFPPTLLPWEQVRAPVPGQNAPLPLFGITKGEHAGETLAELRRIGLQATMVDPAKPDTPIRVPVRDREKVMQIRAAWENYGDLIARFNFG